MRVASVLGLLALLAAAPQAQAQRYTLTGSVLEARTGEPLPGATVLVEGTTLGTVTGVDGSFSFVAPLSAGPVTLRASFIGYAATERRVTLGAEREVTVAPFELREDALGLDEVTVTAAGVPQERRELGNSIGSVSADELQETSPEAIDQALTGKLAGVVVQQNSGNAAGGISVRLRGSGTALGSGDPLYIIDGVIVDNSSPDLIDLGGGAQNRLVDINPEDIERIEVVKGAAAAALYGSLANNGVVQIFTKRGASGEPRVSFETTVSGSQVRNTLDVNRAEFASPADRIAGNAEDRVERFDYQDDLFRTGVGTTQYLSVSGGSPTTQYFLSGGFRFNEGILQGNDFQRTNGRVRVTQDLGRFFEISGGGAYTNSESQDIPNGGLQSAYGALTGFIFGPNLRDIRPDPETGVFPNATVLSNPLEVVNIYDFNQNTNRFTGDIQASFTPVPAFRVDYVLGLDTYEQRARAFIPPGTTAFGQATGFARRSEFTSARVNHDLRARYEAAFGDELESTTLVGGTYQTTGRETLSAQGQNLPLGVETVSGASVPAAPGEFRSDETILGVFAQQTFGYADRLFLTAAGRVDAASVFALGNRYNFYPKLSGSYVAVDGSNVAGPLSNLRLRASYGETGGLTSIGAFDRFTPYSPTTFNGSPGFTPPLGRGNVDVRPERQREIEAGFDAGFFGGRLGFEVTGYSQRTTDLLLNRSLAFSTGFSTGLQNIGTLTNQGIEVLARGLAVSTPVASWNVTATFAANRNEISGLEDPDPNDDVPGVIVFPDGFNRTAAVNGEALGVFYSTQFLRDDAGNILGQAVTQNNDGTQSPAVDANGDPVQVVATLDENGYLRDANGNIVYGLAGNVGVIGDPNPDWTGSLINEIEVGEFGLRFQFDASVGGDVFNFTRRLAALSAFGTLVDYQREIEGELPTGYNGRVFNLFEHWVEDGSFVKLRELSLSYRIPATALPPGLSGLRAVVFGRNLLSFDSYSGYDPEVNVGGQRNFVRGFDFVEIPIPRQFGLTLSATL